MVRLKMRIARSLVLILTLTLFQNVFSPQIASANNPMKPTISSITSGATFLTVNMVTSGTNATQWRWSITRRVTSGCVNSFGDGVVQSTGSLSATISISGLTNGCVYSVRVAAFNGVIGEYAESSKLVGGYSAVLDVIYQNDAGTGSGIVQKPFTTGCNSTTVSTINYSFASGMGPGGCGTTYYTGYLSGYIKAPYTGTVTFKMATDDAGVLAIQGNAIAFVTANTAATGTINMVAGQVYRFEQWFHNDGGPGQNIVYWSYPGQTEQVIPAGNFANDPSVLQADGGCTLGMASRCPAGSAYEIKLATGTNTDGMYWIMVNGTPTLTYSIMNSAISGGGWMLAMKGKKSASDFDYVDARWTNNDLLNATYPERWKANDTSRDIDAKYGVFAFNKANQIMAIFPEQTSYAGGAVAASTVSPINSTKYGFNWIETTTGMRPWAQYNANAVNGNPAGWGGDSVAVAHSGGPTATPTCVNTATTLTNLFSTASRCAFRQVQFTYNASESPYSAIGDNLFYSQDQIRFFGINYGSSNTSNRDRARFGFGWNENNPGQEGSSDGTAGIGIDRQGYSSITTGSINNCCDNAGNNPPRGQGGISGDGDNTSTNIPFEMYMRNSSPATISGNNLRVTFQRQSSLTSGTRFTAPGTNGSNTFRMSRLREGINLNPSTGVLTISEALSVGTYQETVTVTDTDGVTGFRAVTIEVVGDSSETDTALTFTGAASLSTSGNFSLTGNQTWEAWVKPTSACSGGQKTVFGSDAFVMLCISDYWYVGFRNSAGTWSSFQGSQRINYDSWTHLAVVRSGNTASFYINNAQVRVWGGSTWDLTWQVPTVWATASSVYVGGFSSQQYFSGDVDELKIWTEARTLIQITDGMYAAPDLSSAGLFGYWDFNEGSGVLAMSRSQVSDSRYNFAPSNSQWFGVATTTISGPYTVVRIPRTLISKVSGWRVPTSVTSASVLLVGGGGGGSGAYVSSLTSPGGAGGGGGVYLANVVPLQPHTLVTLRVGAGGAGGTPTDIREDARGYRGATSAFSTLSAGGGGAGGYFDSTNQDGLPGTAGGAGGGASYFWEAYQSGSPGLSSSATIDGRTYPASASAGDGAIFNGTAGYTGGGAGGSGSATARGGGIASSISGETITYGVGGGSFGISGWGFSQLTAFGSGGDAPYNWNIGGAQGGSGLIVIRWITASAPIFTGPVSDTITAGMVETFTVSGSPISPLTRSYRWQSSSETGTAASWVDVTTGTGMTSASYITPILETSTSGTRYRYRVVVTDSDTAGLSIVETSTAIVFLTINPRITITGSSVSLTQKYGETQTVTFTIANGTGTRTTATPSVRSGVTWSLVSGSAATIGIGAGLGFGTYYETLTVTDSVTATTSQMITISITKADTITVTNTPVTMTYSGAQASSAYTVTGLKNLETATASVNYTGISPTVLASTSTAPTNAGNYRATPSAIVLSVGASLNNYQGVNYESATVTINKAYQARLSVGQYDAFPGISYYPINVYGGTGLGGIIRTLVDSGTAGCALSGTLILTAANVGTCTVRAVKDGGINYFNETTTATIYWMTFINRYTNSGPATPTDLGLSGSTGYEKRTYETFTVLSFANGSGTAVTSASKNSVMRIIGTGFNASDETTEVIIGFFGIPRSSLTFNTTNPLANFVEFTLPNSSDLDLGPTDVAMKSRKGWAYASGLLTVTAAGN